MNLADRIDRELKRMGLANPAAAERLDVSRETVRSLRTGRTEPTASVLVRLAELTGRSVEWFVTGREPEPGLTPDEWFQVNLIRDMGLSRPEVVRRLTLAVTEATPAPASSGFARNLRTRTLDSPADRVPDGDPLDQRKG